MPQLRQILHRLLPVLERAFGPSKKRPRSSPPKEAAPAEDAARRRIEQESPDSIYPMW